MYPPLFSLNLVDVPSTKTDPQEIYPLLFSVKPKSQAVKPLILCEWGYKRILRREWEESKEFSDCVVLNSLTREKGDTKEFRRLVLCSFGKGIRETQKEFRREKGMKKMNNTSFQGLENQKTSESFWYKEEEEEVQRDSRLVKD
ncbi:hypothetical protein HKD37_13G036382 [Glycine soja]